MAVEFAPPVGTAFPLLLNFREVLLGNGFVVEVEAENGRALCVHESDGHWIYGVNPGGMSAFGLDAKDARREFRAAFSDIMKEIASECESFDEFEREVQAFFHDTNMGYDHAWAEAVNAVRSGDVTASELHRSSADAPMRVRVGIKAMHDVKNTDNEPHLTLDLAA